MLIDYLRGAGPGVELVEALGRSVDYLVTAISAFELAAGRAYARDPAPVDALLRAPLLPLTKPAALRGGRIFRTLRSEGRGIEIRDAMQAGMCLDADRPLVTRNLRHLERISGLQALHPEDWPR